MGLARIVCDLSYPYTCFHPPPHPTYHCYHHLPQLPLLSPLTPTTTVITTHPTYHCYHHSPHPTPPSAWTSVNTPSDPTTQTPWPPSAVLLTATTAATPPPPSAAPSLSTKSTWRPLPADTPTVGLTVVVLPAEMHALRVEMRRGLGQVLGLVTK